MTTPRLVVVQRREFLTHLGCAAASMSLLAASAVRAQQQARVRRVGIILAGTRTLAIEGFVQGMRELGYQAGITHPAGMHKAVAEANTLA